MLDSNDPYTRRMLARVGQTLRVFLVMELLLGQTLSETTASIPDRRMDLRRALDALALGGVAARAAEVEEPPRLEMDDVSRTGLV